MRRCRRAPRCPTSPTRCSTAPTPSCCRPRPPPASTRSRRSRRWRRSASRPRSRDTVELDRDFLNRTFTRVDQSIAMATLFTAFHLKVKAIASLTDSGSTALWMSRHNCGCPIYALTPKVETQRKMALYRNVRPLFLEQSTDRDSVLLAAEDLLRREGPGQARRPDRAHHRRADGQVRRHQHDEDRQGRRTPDVTDSTLH